MVQGEITKKAGINIYIKGFIPRLTPLPKIKPKEIKKGTTMSYEQNKAAMPKSKPEIRSVLC